jgi:hypothetical protein
MASLGRTVIRELIVSGESQYNCLSCPFGVRSLSDGVLGPFRMDSLNKIRLVKLETTAIVRKSIYSNKVP